DHHDDIVISVHNYGEPIDAAAQLKLFEPLQRGRAERDNERHSVGLGLYIVSEIAREHQGRVEVSSSLEAGTTFTNVLPRHSTAVGERRLTPSLRVGPPNHRHSSASHSPSHDSSSSNKRPTSPDSDACIFPSRAPWAVHKRRARFDVCSTLASSLPQQLGSL